MLKLGSEQASGGWGEQAQEPGGGIPIGGVGQYIPKKQTSTIA